MRGGCVPVVLSPGQAARLVTALFWSCRTHVWGAPYGDPRHDGLFDSAAHRSFAAVGLVHYQLYSPALHLVFCGDGNPAMEESGGLDCCGNTRPANFYSHGAPAEPATRPCRRREQP